MTRTDSTIRTPSTVWLGSHRQVRYAIERDDKGQVSLRVSEWTQNLDGWHPVHGIRIGTWGELIGVITAALKAWVVLLTDRRRADPNCGARR